MAGLPFTLYVQDAHTSASFRMELVATSCCRCCYFIFSRLFTTKRTDWVMAVIKHFSKYFGYNYNHNQLEPELASFMS